MSEIGRHFSFANIVSVVALFIALGTGAYAASTLDKNEVKSKHIKRGAVKNADLADDAVTTQKVRNGSLLGTDFADGQLPGSTGSPDTPQQVLDKIKQVDGTGSGLDADTLAGATAASLKDGCPASMTNVSNVICLSKVAGGPSNWGTSLVDCSAQNLRLPSPDEIYLAYTKGLLSTGATYWTNGADGSVGSGISQAVAINGTGGTGVIHSAGASLNYVCAIPPTDG